MSRTRTRSFTLIEAILAIVILTLAIPPMLWAIRQAHVQRVNPMRISMARWLAIEKLEDLIADRHSTTRGWDYVKDPTKYLDETPVTGYAGFDRRVTLAQHGPWDNTTSSWTAGTEYLEATVHVDWTDALGGDRTLQISTIITNYDSS